MQGLIGQVHAVHPRRLQLREALGADALQECRWVRIFRRAE